ncbi:MAG TPA: tetratricopeptide repeat protein [Acidobacteriota bacterium]|nr:tetratricopeptide repeat protein [Acidobacteriota bacterium]
MNRLEKLQELLRKNPRNTFARYGIAMEYRSQGDLERARQALEELMEQAPDYTPLYFQLGSTLQDLGKIEEAADIFQRGIRVAEAKQDFHARDELRAALDLLV